jgi:2,4-dienoyl-CoA reductase-like NADH-dependent reductase (Old Yellow Enzyme family)
MSHEQISIAEPFELRCGLKLSNRIVKAAMEESLGTDDNQPNEHIYRLYERWAKGSYGLLLTGNVQVDERYPGLMTDMIIPSTERLDIDKWKRYAHACQSHGTPAIVQINHAGRQSFLGKRPLMQSSIAPSAVPMHIGDHAFARFVQHYVLRCPREMTRSDIDEVVDKFVYAAEIMVQAGFAGIEIHGSHGYLVSSFLSPKTNRRTDEYGATPKQRMTFLFRIIDGIRAVVPRQFVVGIKLNSSDFSSGGLTEDDARDQIRWIDEHGGIDFIEVSGGTYEAPVMAGMEYQSISVRQHRREAYFLEFAKQIRHLTRIPLIVTGGFRTRIGMNDALRSNACDLIGIGRPTCLQFNLPEILLDRHIPDIDARALSYEIRGAQLFKFIPINVIGSGVSTLWHNWQMHRVAIDNHEPDPMLSVHGYLLSMMIRRLKRYGMFISFCLVLVYFISINNR